MLSLVSFPSPYFEIGNELDLQTGQRELCKESKSHFFEEIIKNERGTPPRSAQKCILNCEVYHALKKFTFLRTSGRCASLIFDFFGEKEI